MSTTPATVPIRLCDHLLNGFDQPFALTVKPLQYVCSFCLADEIEDALLNGQAPSALAANLHFTRCEHADGLECFPRRQGCISALLTRRWAAYFSDSTHGNRIMSVVRELGGKDREPISTPAPVSMAKRTAPKKRKQRVWKEDRTGEMRWQMTEVEPLPTALRNRNDVVVIAPGGAR